MYGEGDRKLSEIKIEVGTFPTRDEGLPTMGLMIQTPNPVDIKNEIQTALKLQELVIKERNEMCEIAKSKPFGHPASVKCTLLDLLLCSVGSIVIKDKGRND